MTPPLWSTYQYFPNSKSRLQFPDYKRTIATRKYFYMARWSTVHYFIWQPAFVTASTQQRVWAVGWERYVSGMNKPTSSDDSCQITYRMLDKNIGFLFKTAFGHLPLCHRLQINAWVLDHNSRNSFPTQSSQNCLAVTFSPQETLEKKCLTHPMNHQASLWTLTSCKMKDPLLRKHWSVFVQHPHPLAGRRGGGFIHSFNEVTKCFSI